MRIKEGILPPSPHIRRDLKTFQNGGFQEYYLGLPCLTITKGYTRSSVTITFLDPKDDEELEYTMEKSEIEYL